MIITKRIITIACISFFLPTKDELKKIRGLEYSPLNRRGVSYPDYRESTLRILAIAVAAVILFTWSNWRCYEHNV